MYSFIIKQGLCVFCVRILLDIFNPTTGNHLPKKYKTILNQVLIFVFIFLHVFQIINDFFFKEKEILYDYYFVGCLNEVYIYFHIYIVWIWVMVL